MKKGEIFRGTTRQFTFKEAVDDFQKEFSLLDYITERQTFL